MSGGARIFSVGMAGWRRWIRRVGRLARRVDVRKPVHAVVIGAVVAGIVAPVADWLVTNERYRLSGPMQAVVERPNPRLKDKLRYDGDKRTSIFNAEGETKTWADPKDKLQAAVGAGGKKDTQLYTATMPDEASRGIKIHDNVNDVSVAFRPQIGLLAGRPGDGRVVYPLKDQAGQMVFTPKANGLKEDIVLASAPAGGRVEVDYALDIPDTLEARMMDDGSLGIYSAQPELWGNVTYGSEADRTLVEKARKAAQKDYVMFRIPAPVIKQSGGGKGRPQARFELEGKTLRVVAWDLAQASYPLSIDPTFFIASTSDFLLGSSDDNVDLSVANQVGRAALSGGSLTAWTQNTNNLPINNFAFGITAYNGYLYMLGGGNAASSTVYYATINLTNGSVGTWTQLTSFNTGRVGAQAFGYNGYLYVVGGENAAGTTQFTSTEYAKLTSTGTISTDSGCGSAWCAGTSLSTGRAFFASAIYRGVMYVMGGETAALNATLTSTVEYARIKGDGSLGSWTTLTGTPLSSARDRFSAAAYNGYVYVTGGLTNSTTSTAAVEYAPILSDGTLGSWVATTSFPTARRDHGMGVERGHLYVYGGCTAGIACATFLGDSEYAVINADGTIGNWQQTQNTNAKRGAADMMATTFYNGYLYSGGGCSKETAGSNDCSAAGRTNLLLYTGFDSPGRFDSGISTSASAPYDQAATVARAGGQAVALNGYLYYISGCSTTNCNTATSYNSIVEKAAINADGTLGTFATTSSIITTDTTNNNAGRIGHVVVAYNNKIYVLGGVEKLKTNADTYRSDVISATQNSDGTLGTWAAETNSLPAVRAFGTAVVWHNRIYYLGGRDSSTVYTTIWTSTISSNAPGTWATAKQTDGVTAQVLNNARWGHTGGIWGNWIYVVGGQSNTTGTYIAATSATEQLVLNNDGTIASVTTRNITGAFATRLMGGMVHNGYLYTFGGYTSGSTSAVVTMNWSRLDPTTGVPGSWSNTNIGNFTTPYGLATARGLTTSVAVDGYMYTLGGCTSTLATTSFTACSSFVSTTNTTELYLPNNGGTGQTGSWSTSGNTALTNAKADAATVVYNGYIYTIGGCTGYTSGACTNSSGFSSEVRYAAISGTGAIGSWSAAANQLSTATTLLQAAAYNGYLYVLGGQTAATGAVTTVQYAAIGSTGNLGTWTSGTSMNTARRNFGAAIAGGYLYAVGGEDASGTRLATTEYAALSSNGSVGSWTTSGNNFTTARSGQALVAYNGRLYVVGGYDGTNSLADIQYSTIDTSTGAIGTWANTIDVPRGMQSRQAVAANGYMYFLGNEGSGTAVSYADINANGTLGILHDQASALAGAHAHGGAVIYNGFLYALGGCTLSSGACSTVSSATENAGQKAISRVAHYSKLFDTQVDTSPTQLVLSGGLSGPGSAIGVQFQTASTSDPTLGVAQLINPAIFGTYYTVQALNSSGVNVGVAFDYFIVIAMDDSQSGTFPDVNQVAQTSVANITLYYHANPGRRLRHGASFTNTGCNQTPANGCILDTAP